MQSLFEWDFHGKDPALLPSIVERNIAEFAPGVEETEFIWRLANGVVEYLPKIDVIIERAAPEWPIDMITAIDRKKCRLRLRSTKRLNSQRVSAGIHQAVSLMGF